MKDRCSQNDCKTTCAKYLTWAVPKKDKAKTGSQEDGQQKGNDH